MMEDHYGLRGRPFQLTPDPRFWYDTATHGKAMAYLGYGLSQGEGFVVITGDPGAGKTTLLGHLLGELDGERLNVVKIVSTHLRADDLLRLVAQGLGLKGDDVSKASLLLAIERGLHDIARAGRRTLLVVDEAQALPGESLDELRMLSNFQAGGYPLLQIFLLGQPEFRLVLQQPAFEQLRQRVIAMHHLAPMEMEEVESYLMHRLTLVGWSGRPRFTAEALATMHRWSGGIPRRLNQLASRVLLYGAVEQIENFGAPDVAAVIDDIEQEAVIEPATVPVPDPVPVRPGRVAELRAMPEGSAETRALERRVAELEAQVASQSDALRRVLSLLVDWVDKDDGRSGIDLDTLRGTAA